MMKEAGINVVRIAESTWGTLEPQDGVFDFTHVDRVLEAMQRAVITVIVGTPTYAVPTWLVRKYPDVLAVTPRGQNQYGPRQNMDITNPHFRLHAERVIRKLLEHVKDHPAIIGYQVDNETKHYQTAGPAVQALFVQYVKDGSRRSTPSIAAFGLDYWSNRIDSWEDFPSTVGQHQRQPQRRVREVPAPAGHRLPGLAGGASSGSTAARPVRHAELRPRVARVLVRHPARRRSLRGGTGDGRGRCRHLPPDPGRADRHRDLLRRRPRALDEAGQNYLVIETQAQGFPQWVPYPGQLRLQAFSHLASGANMLAYWHWHSIHNSAETYWKGLLSHDFRPNPTYDEAKTIGRDFAALGPQLVNLRKTNQVAILFSNEALTAFNAFGFGWGARENYNDVLRPLYDALYRMNVGVDFVDPSSTDLEQLQADRRARALRGPRRAAREAEPLRRARRPRRLHVQERLLGRAREGARDAAARHRRRGVRRVVHAVHHSRRA